MQTGVLAGISLVSTAIAVILGIHVLGSPAAFIDALAAALLVVSSAGAIAIRIGSEPVRKRLFRITVLAGTIVAIQGLIDQLVQVVVLFSPTSEVPTRSQAI